MPTVRWAKWRRVEMVEAELSMEISIVTDMDNIETVARL
jgi:hypothetical protein